MSRSKRVIAMLLCAVLMIAAVTGIAFWTAGYQEPVAEPGLYVDGKKVDDPGAMMTIGGTEVDFATYRHYFLLNKSFFMMYYGEDLFDYDPDGDYAHVLKQSAEAELENTYIWMDIAREYDITLDDADRETINTTLAEQKETYGEDFERYLTEDMFFTDEAHYLSVTELQTLMEKAQNAYRQMLRDENEKAFTEAADKEFIENNLSAKHILIAFDTEAEDTEANEAEVKQRAEEVWQQIMDSDDPVSTFNALLAEVGEDPGMETNPDGYTFKEGDMVTEFYEGTKALKEGEISLPIRSSYGYHIILRQPLEQSTIEANRETAISTQVEALVTEKTEAVKETLTITYGPYYSQFGANDIV